jgi:transcriptional regulator with GAF, ATPase, and Fis domain
VDPVWHAVVFAGAASASAPMVEALVHAGLDVSAFDPARPSGPGIVFFDRLTTNLCDWLQDVTDRGRERVLAVAMWGTSLGSRGVWTLLDAGASDVLAWDHSKSAAEDIVARLKRWDEVDHVLFSPVVQNALVGRCANWVRTLRRVVEAAWFTTVPLLITGESGTGKELVARLVHSLDRRPGKRSLSVLDCSTLVPELSGSEFFGHERGAFTGAVAARDGAFALAHGGTLFLDEIGELPLGLQTQLLRAVQERTYKRVGGNTWHHAEFRVISATNRDLMGAVVAGHFRADLYHRLAGVCCTIPPLRDRSADIPLLARSFLSELVGSGDAPEISEPVLRYLMERDYPGNVRELKLLLARLLYRHAGRGPLSVGDIPEDERPAAPARERSWRDAGFEDAIRRAVAARVQLKDIGRAAEDVAEQTAVREENGNLHLAALRLGVTDRALQLRRAARRERGNRLGQARER